jgi:hypothetical protein
MAGVEESASGESLDTSDLEAYMGVPMEVQRLREPVAVNDIRRWAMAMHNANPLHYDPDWRWMLDRTDTPWYNSIRLFRQKTFGDWAGVMDKIRTDIALL